MNNRAAVLLVVPIVAACSGTASPSEPADPVRSGALATQSVTHDKLAETRSSIATYPVTIAVTPGAVCSLHPAGVTDPDVPVYADDLGVARFAAVRAKPVDAVTMLSLDCTDDGGHATTYPVDLTTDVTFQPVPSTQTGLVRPALLGDPMQYSKQELIDRDYGLRPDPGQNPTAYATWLKMVSAPARKITTKDAATNISADTSLTWGGSLFTGATFEFVSWTFTLPTFSVCSGGGCLAKAALWGGLGGWNGDFALIQSGVQVVANSTSVGMYAWKEYAQKPGIGGPGYATEASLFGVNAGDFVEGEAWACDSNGASNVNGGYGCYYVEDGTSFVYKSCTKPSDSCPSLAQINAFAGPTAEAIVELNGSSLDQYGDFYMNFTANDSAGNAYQNSNATPTLITLVNGSSQTLETVTTSNPDANLFHWVQAN
jgi:hypothetical protein